jgi:hypothetical protein
MMMMDSYEVYRVKREEKKDQMRRAAKWRLLREAGLVPGMQVKQTACRLLCQLGHALVALGEQLERYGQPRLAAR